MSAKGDAMSLRWLAHTRADGRRRQRSIVGAVAGAVMMLALLLLASPALATSDFLDVPPSHQLYGGIMEMVDRGIISGYTNGNFGPDDPVTRQQFAKLIVKTMDLSVTGSEECPFTDVLEQTGSDPYYPSKYVAVCAANGITIGKTPTTFDPTGNITRQQVMTMIVRAADNVAPGTLLAPPADYSGILSYADPTHGANAKRFDYNQLSHGFMVPDATWQTQNATRGEVALMLWNLLGVCTYGSPWSNTPKILTPADGTMISALPRTTTVTWTAVPNAKSYWVVVIGRNSSGGTGNFVLTEEVFGTSYTFDFDRAGEADILVSALMALGPSVANGVRVEYTQ